jgi:hypothetical protein
LIDENAYGLLIAWFDIEDVEYSMETEQFVERYGEFRATVLGCLDAMPLGQNVRALDLGHAFYLELADGDEQTDPIRWARDVRSRMNELGFSSLSVVCHGGRWVEASGETEAPPLERIGDVTLVRASRPSEPLRKALAAESAARPSDDETPGWGPGVYVESEVIEALGRKLKNAPTPLAAADSSFYRVA